MNNLRSSLTAVLISIAMPASAGLFGPPKFSVQRSDDRFSLEGLTTYSGLGNRISRKSLAGGVHIDASGVFIEPVVSRKADGTIAALSLFIHNETSEDTGSGDVLSLGRPEKISFVTGEGLPIALSVRNGERDLGATSFNSITRTAATRVSESGFVPVTRQEYERIMNAPALIARVDGSKRSMTYELRDVSKSFQENLRVFWRTYLVAN